MAVFFTVPQSRKKCKNCNFFVSSKNKNKQTEIFEKKFKSSCFYVFMFLHLQQKVTKHSKKWFSDFLSDLKLFVKKKIAILNSFTGSKFILENDKNGNRM